MWCRVIILNLILTATSGKWREPVASFAGSGWRDAFTNLGYFGVAFASTAAAESASVSLSMSSLGVAELSVLFAHVKI